MSTRPFPRRVKISRPGPGAGPGSLVPQAARTRTSVGRPPSIQRKESMGGEGRPPPNVLARVLCLPLRVGCAGLHFGTETFDSGQGGSMDHVSVRCVLHLQRNI